MKVEEFLFALETVQKPLPLCTNINCMTSKIMDVPFTSGYSYEVHTWFFIAKIGPVANIHHHLVSVYRSKCMSIKWCTGDICHSWNGEHVHNELCSVRLTTSTDKTNFCWLHIFWRTAMSLSTEFFYSYLISRQVVHQLRGLYLIRETSTVDTSIVIARTQKEENCYHSQFAQHVLGKRRWSYKPFINRKWNVDSSLHSWSKMR